MITRRICILIYGVQVFWKKILHSHLEILQGSGGEKNTYSRFSGSAADKPCLQEAERLSSDPRWPGAIANWAAVIRREAWVGKSFNFVSAGSDAADPVGFP